MFYFAEADKKARAAQTRLKSIWVFPSYIFLFR